MIEFRRVRLWGIIWKWKFPQLYPYFILYVNARCFFNQYLNSEHHCFYRRNFCFDYSLITDTTGSERQKVTMYIAREALPGKNVDDK